MGVERRPAFLYVLISRAPSLFQPPATILLLFCLFSECFMPSESALNVEKKKLETSWSENIGTEETVVGLFG